MIMGTNYLDLNKNFIVIGGNTAGLAAANQIRRLRPDANITVLEAGAHISYGSCGLPYFISGIIDDINSLFVYSREYFEQKKNIKILLNHKVVSIDTSKKEIKALRLETIGNETIVKDETSVKDNIQTSKTSENIVSFTYDKLVIASGASPVRFDNIYGADSKNIFYFRNVDDALKLKNYLKKNNPKSACIIGGGYIGLLIADALYKVGLKVNIIDAKPKIYADYEDEIVNILNQHLANQNIKTYTNYSLVKFNFNSNSGLAFSAVISQNTKDKKNLKDEKYENFEEIDADIFIICAGIKANTDFLKNSFIDLGDFNAIKVSTLMQTSNSSIYAAGDCCLIKNIITKSYEYIPTAQNALKTGRIAGANAAGEHEYFPGSLATKIDKVFDFEIARTGIDMQTALKYNFDVVKITDQYYSHVKAVPGAQIINISIIVDKKSRKILGAQMIGKDGVGKRIDIFAAAITAELKVDDVYMLDCSYSPFISTLPDPVNKICGKAVLLLK